MFVPRWIESMFFFSFCWIFRHVICVCCLLWRLGMTESNKPNKNWYLIGWHLTVVCPFCSSYSDVSTGFLYLFISWSIKEVNLHIIYDCMLFYIIYLFFSFHCISRLLNLTSVTLLFSIFLLSRIYRIQDSPESKSPKTP